MSIQFRCSNCSRLLSVPEDSVGKKARCPQCSTVLTVPAASSEPLAGGADPQWGAGGGSPFDAGAQNPFGDFAAGGGLGGYQDPKNPYAAPTTDASFMGKPVPQGARSGLPWERLGKSAGNFWSTSKLVITAPTEAFSIMWREGGLGDPLVFCIVGALIGGLFSAIYNSLFQASLLGMVAAGGQQPGGNEAGMVGIQIVANFIGALIGGTIGAAIGAFVGAAINHVCLYLFKSATFPYETTFRVVCYTSGATALLQVIPFCGQLIQGIASIVILIIGFSEAHQITKGKSAMAVLLPVIVCCVIGIAIVAVVAGLGGFAAMNAANQGP